MTTAYLYRKQWQLDRSRGITRTIDATEVRLHLATLQGAGWSLRAIAGASGASASALSPIARGEQERVTRKVAERVLAVKVGQVPSVASRQTTEPFVPRIGTTRRLQALLFMGWGHRQMREHAGGGLNTAALLHQQGRWVTRTTHDKVAEMYRALSHRQGPSSKARTYARQRGYAGPLDWDDIDLDVEPDQADDGTSGRAESADRFAEIEHLLSLGASLDEALERVGWRRKAYEKALERRNRGDGDQ